MSEIASNFKSLPPEYQRVIQLAQDRFQIFISPLQELAGGWSGAIIYLARVASADSGDVRHLVLKLDRKHPKASSDEISRHNTVQEKSPVRFVSNHIPDIAYPRIEEDNALAIFYAIAGGSLRDFRTLSSFRRQNRLETLFQATNRCLLEEWNAELSFEQVELPQDLLRRWLGFRLDPGGKIENFLRDTCRVNPDMPGFIVDGMLLPNPLHYAREENTWGDPQRPFDAAVGLQHSDLNTNNILAKFSRQAGDELEGYYLIDFALFKENSPLLYDQRYLEISYLVHTIEKGAYSSVIDLICRYSENNVLNIEQTPIEVVGVNAAVSAARFSFENWTRENHPSLQDDLWGQYWLAGTAAGMSYCHKAGQPDSIRLAGLIYAAANLKQYFKLFDLPMPTEASQLTLHDQDMEGVSFGRTPSPGSAAHKVPTNLPAPATNFIGRVEELQQVKDLLLDPQVRLVTLTGPGGTGKTRLSLEVSRALLDRFPDGVYFIDLAQVRDPTLVIIQAAHTIGIREGGGQPLLDTLKTFLSPKTMLLIFDNFEQVTAAAEEISSLLEAAADVKFMVTSRIPLHLRAEQEYPVSPLEVPEEITASVEEAIEIESVALFQQTARSINPRFEINQENFPAVLEICRRLDGLPLAIEIAAARIKMLPPQALLKRFDKSLNLLVGTARDLPERQQTMRAAIDWSYELLEPQEKTMFTRLGIFAGGFSLESAEQIGNPNQDLDVFGGIESLLDKSLLRQVRSVDEEPRFAMLQTIREYALEKAAEAGMLEELRLAHCKYFSSLAGVGMGEGVFGAQSILWLQRYEEEHDNLRAALDWALQHPQQGIELAMAMMLQISWFWYRYGYLKEGNDWTERALQATDGMGDSLPRALALVARNYLALWSGDLVIAAQRGLQAVEMSQRLGVDLAISASKLGYGTTLINQGCDKEAYPHLVDAIELFDDQDQPWSKGAALVHLANVSLGLGQVDEAAAWLEMATPVLQSTGDVWNMAFGLSNYGEVARVQGDFQKAEEYYLRTEQLYQQADAKGDQARLVHNLGYIAQHKGEYKKARALFLQSLEDFRELGNQRGIAECLAGLAGLAAEQGQHGWSAPLLSAAESMLFSFGGAWWPADRVEIERARESLQESLNGEFEGLWAQGQSMDVDEAIEYAFAWGK